jgi:hypothetical protein
LNPFYKYRFYLLIPLIGLLFLGLLSIHSKKKDAEKKLISMNKELQRLRTQLDFLRIKFEADELFMQEDYDAAFKKYTLLIEENPEDYMDLYNLKLEMFSRIKQKEETWDSEISKKNYKVKMLLTENENLVQKISEQEEKWQDTLDSLRKVHSVLTETLNTALNNLSEAGKKQQIVFKSSKGSRVAYMGNIEDGMANGNGTGVWASGSVYEGEWKDNMRHGKGVFEWVDGERYEGNYLNDKRNGFGIYLWKNGEKYEGEWNDDMRNGFGVIYEKNGKVKLKGNWKNDEFIKNEINGNGSS